MEILGASLMLIGSLIFLISSLGLIRMPDIYNRIQTGTKATTMGTLLLLIGVGFLHPFWWTKLLIIALFILLTNPISSHVVARAAHFNKEDKSDLTLADSLEESNESKEMEV
jgi:multicomponent Na+:H+ antiporter subunit G